MNDEDLKFFKMAAASAIGILVLLLITSIVIAFYSADTRAVYYPQSTTNTYAASPTQWSNLDRSQYQQEQPSYQTENSNVPPCMDPCKMRVEYANKYFLPYPKYTYDRFYYQPYRDHPYYVEVEYPINQRVFHHRIIERDYAY